jgi:hypothetical protein
MGGQVAPLHCAQIGRDAIAEVNHVQVLAVPHDEGVGDGQHGLEGFGAYCATIFMTATMQSMW